MSACLVIAGFHRSGTSLAAEMLQGAGLYLGEQLGAPDRFNPRGHFEDRVVVDLHDGLLKQHGSNWQFCDEVQLHKTTAAHQEMRELVESRNAAGLNWGFKDPRVCLFLDDWLSTNPEMRVLIIYRHWVECVRSIHSRAATLLCTNLPEVGGDQLALFSDPELPLKMWLAYNRRLIAYASKYPKTSLVVPHHTLIEGYPLIDRVRTELQIELSPPQENVTDTSLLHHNVDDPRPDWISAGLVEQLDQTWESLNKQANVCSVAPPRRTSALAPSTKLQREIELKLGDPPASQASGLAPDIKPLDASAEACRLEAERLFRAGEARAALEWAQRACSIQSSASALTILGRIQLRLVDFGAARISLLRAIEIAPDQPLLQLHLANVEAASGDMKEALNRAEAAIAMKPKNTTPFLARRGWLRRWNGILDGAMDDFRNVLRCDPQHVDAWLGKISVYRHRAEFEQALNAADSLLEFHPDLVRAQTARALVLMELGKSKEGVEAHDQAVRLAFDRHLLRARLETSYLPEMPTETARGNFLSAVAKYLPNLMPQDAESSSDQTSQDS
ncbi:MAG: hypothetical protein P8N09_13600 [Planctomycetota bacterium]|nr:hypothetical protein [Planctomycetota bacterium]